MTRTGIELRSTRPLVNTLPVGPSADGDKKLEIRVGVKYIIIKINLFVEQFIYILTYTRVIHLRFYNFNGVHVSKKVSFAGHNWFLPKILPPNVFKILVLIGDCWLMLFYGKSTLQGYFKQNTLYTNILDI